MAVLDVFLQWVHVICVVVFLGGIFLATFVLMPVVKTHMEYDARHGLIVQFVPRARSVMRVVVGTLVVSGVARAALLHFTHAGPASAARLSVFGVKLLFALTPIMIFLLAPKILGKRSKEGLCCDPDAEGPAFNACGVMTTTGEALHYTAIAGGWLAVLFGVILTRMH